MSTAPSSPAPGHRTGPRPTDRPRTGPHSADDQRPADDSPGSAEAVGPALIVDGVHRAFGSVHALNGISFTAPRGRVTALVGPNGCGKSTLMLILATLLAPDAGRVEVCGLDPRTHASEVRARVGWMPDQFGTWDSLKVREVLSTVGDAYFMDRDDIAERSRELLALVDLDSLAQQPAHVLSRGQKQRLGLARALMHRPEVLILDEPASGLDPSSRRNLQRIVRAYTEAGGSVLISSHILSELEQMGDHVVLMDRGALVAETSVQDLSDSARPWRIQSLDQAALWRALEELSLDAETTGPEQSVSGHAEAELMVAGDARAAEILASLIRADAHVVAFAPSAGRLESAYLASDAARRKGAL